MEVSAGEGVDVSAGREGGSKGFVYTGAFDSRTESGEDVVLLDLH
jgi:hypothetical protein